MGIIYRIRFNDYYYYGSTIHLLESRISKHKCQSKKTPNVKLYRMANELGWDTAVIELIEEYDELDGGGMLQREDKYIVLTDPLCLNTKRAYNSIEDKRLKKNENSRMCRLRKSVPKPLPLTIEEKAQRQREASARWREAHPDKVMEQYQKEKDKRAKTKDDKNDIKSP